MSATLAMVAAHTVVSTLRDPMFVPVTLVTNWLLMANSVTVSIHSRKEFWSA